MKKYIGTKLIEAEPAFRCMDGNGNTVITRDPHEAFPNYPSVEDGYRVRYPDGYVGRDICMGKIRDQVWKLLGFLLQTAVNGVK